MKLIIGLGNPGIKYQNNRHNAGFQFIDYLIENRKVLISKLEFLNNSQISNKKFQKQADAEIYDFSKNILLMKPLTFMNRSGKAVIKSVKSYEIGVKSDLIVIHDDLDIPLGKFKIQKTTGPKLHNGLESIENHLKTKDFWRVRIGVDNRMNTGWIDGENYSLQDFRPEERKIIEELFPKILNRLEERLTINN